MTISDAAKAHHDQLFGDRVSTLARTDPEFIAYFDNFAFDEILADAADLDDAVDLHTRLLVQLAAVLAAGGLAEFRVLATAGLPTPASPRSSSKSWSTTRLPTSAWPARTTTCTPSTTSSPPPASSCRCPGRPPAPPRPGSERGQQVQERIVGAGRVDQMHADAPPDCKHFQRYLTGNCFGDTVARDGLDLPTRELLTFAMLTALGGADAQVRGHVTGNLNVGNTRARLLAVLTVLVPFIGYPRTLNALAAINDITPPTST